MKQTMYVVAVILGVTGCLFALVAIATPGWLSSKKYSVGLYMLCGLDQSCISYTDEGSISAIKAFEISAFLCSLAASIVSIIHQVKFVNKHSPNRELPFISGILFLSAGLLAFLGAIIVSAKFKGEIEGKLKECFNMDYSFGLAVAGGMLNWHAGTASLFPRILERSKMAIRREEPASIS